MPSELPENFLKRLLVPHPNPNSSPLSMPLQPLPPQPRWGDHTLRMTKLKALPKGTFLIGAAMRLSHTIKLNFLLLKSNVIEVVCHN